MGDARSGLRTGAGALIGLGAFAVTITVITMTGSYHLDGRGSFGGALTTPGLMCCRHAERRGRVYARGGRALLTAARD